MDQPPTSNRTDDLRHLPHQGGIPVVTGGSPVASPATGEPPAATDNYDQGPPAPVAPPLTPIAWLRANSLYLIIFGLIFVWLYTNYGLEGVWKAFLVAVALSMVVFIHELGHFLTAKWCDVHVQTFSIGFGPALPGCSFQHGETTYKLAVVPLGGYVSMVGEGTEDEGSEDDPRSFKNKTVGQRMLIISAGVIMNVILGCVCFVFVYRFHGVERAPAIVARVDPGSPAWGAGVRTGEAIKRIDTVEKPMFDNLRAAVALHQGSDDPIHFVFGPLSGDGPELKVDITPRKDYGDPYPIIGVASPSRLQLVPREVSKVRELPVYYNSPAAAARVLDLQPGDVVVRCTDPADGSKVTDLPKKPAQAFAELCQRLRALEGKPLELYVLPKDAPAGTEPKRMVVPPKGFDFGDRIVGTTDPGTPDQPFNVKALPLDPTNPKEGDCDPFVFYQWMKELAGKPAVLQVVRDNKAKDRVNILVPPAFHYTLGMTMKIGKVVGIRDGSPASKTDLKASTEDADGDELVELKVSYVGDGKNGKPAEAGEQVVKVAEVGPERLPDELARLAAAGKKKGFKVLVTATVQRLINRNPQSIVLQPAMAWDDSWDFQQESPVSVTSPLSIPQLGIAYRILTMVETVHCYSPAVVASAVGQLAVGSCQLAVSNWQSSVLCQLSTVNCQLPTAARAMEVQKVPGFWERLWWFFGLAGEKEREVDGPENPIQAGDQIEKIRFLQGGKKIGDTSWTRWHEVISQRGAKRYDHDQWPHFFWALQSGDYHEVEVYVYRDGKELGQPLRLKATEDFTWPLEDRGLLLTLDMRLQTVDSTMEAVQLGVERSLSFIKQMYLNLVSLLRGRISTKTLGGPIELASQTFAAAEDPYILVLWLGMISLNLAVVNFLPIPVLDGGHMVFLIYEKLRGQPPSETVRAAATYLGLAMILSLMVFVFYQDIMRRILWWL